MKFKSRKISDWKYESTVVEINTLEEMLEFISKNGCIIVDYNKDLNIQDITIYDDYRE